MCIFFKLKVSRQALGLKINWGLTDQGCHSQLVENRRLVPSISPQYMEVGTSILYVEEGTEAVSCSVL